MKWKNAAAQGPISKLKKFKMEVLSKEQIEKELNNIPGWVLDENEIEKTFEFTDFKAAINFVNKIAEVAEEHGHHPDIEINYNKVELELSTHSVGGVTEKDISLAKAIDSLT